MYNGQHLEHEEMTDGKRKEGVKLLDDYLFELWAKGKTEQGFSKEFVEAWQHKEWMGEKPWLKKHSALYDMDAIFSDPHERYNRQKERKAKERKYEKKRNNDYWEWYNDQSQEKKDKIKENCWRFKTL
jgi:hypothetical protein